MMKSLTFPIKHRKMSRLLVFVYEDVHLHGCALRVQKMVLDSPEMELEVVVSHHVGAEN